MDRQPPAIYVIGLFTEQVKQLVYTMLIRKLNVESVSDIIRNSAVFRSPRVSSSSSS